jgi:hypothetical protein
MPQSPDPIVLSSVGNGPGRSPFSQHRFVGGNAFMLEMLRDNAMEIGVTADAVHFDSTIAFTRQQLQTRTALLTAEAGADQDLLTINIKVENLAGHKFPTGFPSRRAWLRVLVSDEQGHPVFESGGYDDDGTIRNLDGTAAYMQHHDVITGADQVQIYESVMVDVNDAVTRTLLRGARYVKDNRIPPKGFSAAAERFADMAVAGMAAQDANFNHDESGEGSGSDTVTYEIDVSGRSGQLQIIAELLYQSIKPAFVADIAGHDTPAVNRFVGYYDAADKTPELVQTALLQVDLVTGVAGPLSSGTPERFALLANCPNPFNASTVIPYTLTGNPAEFELAVYDLRGRRVRVLASGVKAAGSYAANWDGRDSQGNLVGSSVYIYRLTSGRQTIARKLILLK